MAKLNLTLVDTPYLSNAYERQISKQILSVLTSEINNNDGWSRACTSVMKNSPRTLFGFDRLCYVLGNALGSHKLIIALNPKMIFCYHPDCYNTKRNPLNLKNKWNLVLKRL